MSQIEQRPEQPRKGFLGISFGKREKTVASNPQTETATPPAPEVVTQASVEDKLRRISLKERVLKDTSTIVPNDQMRVVGESLSNMGVQLDSM